MYLLVVLALRTYALWHKDKRILWSLLFLAGVRVTVFSALLPFG